jgi:lipoate-protein ligase A
MLNRSMAALPIFKILAYWKDEHARCGAENMAVDQLLLEQAESYPVLRLYRWSEPTVSFGYFHRLQDARSAFPCNGAGDLTYVRRWTGGGIVDHRVDLTYTLAIPRGCPLADEGGMQSYRLIHQALAATLNKLGQDVHLVAANEGCPGRVCFTNPVACDLIDSQGLKIAGAGQRRTRHGLLHQGSLLTGIDAGVLGRELASHLADTVSGHTVSDSFAQQVAALAAERYHRAQWRNKK